MWILPKNYQLSSAFAADMVASKEDLTLPGLNIESSLFWRSKPSPLRTWLTRWKQDSYLPHLFTRILKPSQRKSFETELTSLLAATLVNRSVTPVREKGKTIQDISGRSLGDTCNQLDLFNASLKMSKDTSRLDSPASSAIWKKMVIDQRGEYSQRVKLAHHTRENESTSWATPNTMDAVETAEKMWPTPTTQDNNQVAGQYKNPKSGTTLGGAVRNWPTPRASEYKDCGPVGSKSHTHMKNKRYLCAEAKEESMPRGHLNPAWVEWLMGVPTGWTELDF